MEEANTRRVLAVCLSGQEPTLSGIVKDITGAAPKGPTEDPAQSLAGTTHNLLLKTKYYSATVPIWLDTIESPEEWAESFLSDEAKEVLEVLGGLLVVFDLSSASDGAARTRELLSHVGRVVRDGLGGWEWDGVRVAVGVGESSADDMEEWDELCAEAGMEFIHVGSGGAGREKMLQDFGEKTGIARVMEALEANDWEQAGGDLDGDNDLAGAGSQREPAGQNLEDLDPENLDFGIGQADMDSLRKALWASTEGVPDEADADKATEADDEVDDDDVAKVEKMMRKLQAAREAGQTMGEAQRRRMAAKAVQDVMKEM